VHVDRGPTDERWGLDRLGAVRVARPGGTVFRRTELKRVSAASIRFPGTAGLRDQRHGGSAWFHCGATETKPPRRGARRGAESEGSGRGSHGSAWNWTVAEMRPDFIGGGGRSAHLGRRGCDSNWKRGLRGGTGLVEDRARGGAVGKSASVRVRGRRRSNLSAGGDGHFGAAGKKERVHPVMREIAGGSGPSSFPTAWMAQPLRGHPEGTLTAGGSDTDRGRGRTILPKARSSWPFSRRA